jgi:hypothetical protein
MMVPVDTLDEPTCSEESSTSEEKWPLTGKDILLTSIAIEREDTKLFDTKFLDSLSSNEDSNLEEPLAMLYSAEGKNELNYQLDFEDIAGDIEDDNKMMGTIIHHQVDLLDKSTCSEESSKSEDTENKPKEEEMETSDSQMAVLEEEDTRIETSQQSPTNSSAPTNDDHKEEEKLYMVEDIVARRLSQRDRGKSYVPTCPEDYYEYRVKWEGYKPKYNTWEPYENISECTEHLEMLYEKEKKRKQPKQQPLKKTSTKAEVRSGQQRTTWNSGASGESQVVDNNNNFEQFDRNKEEQQQERKRKRIKKEQQSDDDDEELWVPETKRRKITGRSSSSSVPIRKLPRRLASSSRK